jgi:hypothetical protein
MPDTSAPGMIPFASNNDVTSQIAGPQLHSQVYRPYSDGSGSLPESTTSDRASANLGDGVKHASD